MAKITVSAIKADVGSIAGHTRPSEALLDAVRGHVREVGPKVGLLDWHVQYTGDDVCIVSTHRHGVGNAKVHELCWNAFVAGTQVAKKEGLYGAGQDLLKDAFSGNVRGLGPGVAELDIELRPNEAILVVQADKTDPGAFNLPLYLAFADPMWCPGLMLAHKRMGKGFSFQIMDMNHTDGDRLVELHAPEELYKIAALLRDNQRFAVELIVSRTSGEPAAAVSTSRLHNIAGTYVGKDDPVAVIRAQHSFPATEEVLSPFALAHYVGGDSRGSHVMPLVPMPVNSAVDFVQCCPIVSCVGISIAADGTFSRNVLDVFGGKLWDPVRAKGVEKALEMRRQGFSGAAMLPYDELEYGGIKDLMAEVEERFTVRK